jgi:hypothetical protein
LNVEEARVPIDDTAVMQTTIIRDNITAYSTAVGPSSLFKKRFSFKAKFFIISSRLARHSPSLQQKSTLKLNIRPVAAETCSLQED